MHLFRILTATQAATTDVFPVFLSHSRQMPRCYFISCHYCLLSYPPQCVHCSVSPDRVTSYRRHIDALLWWQKSQVCSEYRSRKNTIAWCRWNENTVHEYWIFGSVCTVCNTGWFKKMDSISYVYISWTIHGMWMIYITFERGGPKFSNTTARALA